MRNTLLSRPEWLAFLIALALMVPVWPNAAQAETGLRQLETPLLLYPRISPNCQDGLVYDDGSFETGYLIEDEVTIASAMRFDLLPQERRVEQLCMCWTRTGGDSSVEFDLVVYDGSVGNDPGQVLTGLGNLRAEAVPFFPQVAWYSVDISSLGIELDADRVFIGPAWNPARDGEVALCGDDNGPNFRPTRFSPDDGASWTDLGGLFPDLKALGIRAELGEGAPPEACVPDANKLCLNQGRFALEVDWRNARGESGPGSVVPVGSDDSGLFWFFNPDNWEMLIKVLDGCSSNGNYWVFFAATTTVEFTLKVTDSQTGTSKTYVNPLGNRANAVTDTQAFATCP